MNDNARKLLNRVDDMAKKINSNIDYNPNIDNEFTLAIKLFLANKDNEYFKEMIEKAFNCKLD